MNIPVFIPHLGCPNDCVFCNQNRISGKNAYPQLDEVERDIIAAIETIGHRKDVEIAFFGGSFTGLKKELQRDYLDMAKHLVEKYQLKGIRFSTRPDYMGESEFELLDHYPITAIELGVQSMDETVLKASKRYYPLSKVDEAVERIKKAHIECGLQMMLGLPGDSYETLQRTVNKIIALDPDTLRLYPTVVIQDTELAELYHKGVYKPLTVEEAVELAADIVPRVEQAGIKMIRIGLQASDGLDVEGRVAGPFHPAFGELVRDRIVQNHLEESLNHIIDEEEQEERVVYLKASGKSYQQCIGHKKMVKKHLTTVMKARQITLTYQQDASVEAGQCKVSARSKEVTVLL